jgi:hypothetical protein
MDMKQLSFVYYTKYLLIAVLILTSHRAIAADSSYKYSDFTVASTYSLAFAGGISAIAGIISLAPKEFGTVMMAAGGVITIHNVATSGISSKQGMTATGLGLIAAGNYNRVTLSNERYSRKYVFEKNALMLGSAYLSVLAFTILPQAFIRPLGSDKGQFYLFSSDDELSVNYQINF